MEKVESIKAFNMPYVPMSERDVKNEIVHDNILINEKLNDIVIRSVDLSKDDLNTIVRIFKEGMSEINAWGYINRCLNEDMNYTGFKNTYLNSDKKANFWVATSNGEIVAIVGLEQKDENTCEFKRLSIRRDYRGKKLGSKMAKFVLDYAKKVGFKTCYLSTLDIFSAARAIYTKLGFVLENADKPINRGTKKYSIIYYTIELSDYKGDISAVSN